MVRNPDFGEYDGDGGHLKDERTLLIKYKETGSRSADIEVREIRSGWPSDIYILLGTSNTRASEIYDSTLKCALNNCNLQKPQESKRAPVPWGTRDPSLREEKGWP